MKKFLLLYVCAVAGAAEFYTGQAARMVIGQKTFTSATPGASEDLVGAVSGLAVAGDILFVADANRVGAGPNNHRVLIYRNISQELPPPDAEISPYAGRCPVCTGTADVVVGQPDFAKSEFKVGTQDGMRLPTAVASDGRRLVVADTDNNRVLIWNSIPAVNGQSADLVIGQQNFQGFTPGLSSSTLRGPQGVWIQGERLFVADTQNHRVLIWNSFPTSNGKAADLVLGQPDFTTRQADDLNQQELKPTQNNLLNPVSVTSDGTHLFVADLGHNRVLIWNSIPTQNQQPASVVVGQKDFTSFLSNNVLGLCLPTGTSSEGNELFPPRCAATMEFPRFALSDGRRLFVADGGNDRVLVFNEIPTDNGARADLVLGQLSGQVNQISDSAEPLLVASARCVRAPMSLAWDGTNLYVSDPYNRRVLVYSEADLPLVNTAARNAASLEVYAVGAISFSGEPKENDEVTVKIEDKEYKYKGAKDEQIPVYVTKLVDAINANGGDPNALATPNLDLGAIILTARAPGEDGNAVDFSVTTSEGATILATTSGATLSGGQDAAKIAPGTIVTIIGDNLSDGTESARPNADPLPWELADTQVYFDGIRAPLFYVSPTTIRAQIPWEVLDVDSINAYVRTRRRLGRVTVTAPIAIPIIRQNPGIFADAGPDPRPGIVEHFSSYATGTVSVDGTAQTGNVATITIEDRSYTYTVQQGNSLADVRDGLIAAINQNPEEVVEASPAGVFTRVRLRAKKPGPDGNGIKYGVQVPEGAQVILTPTTPALCCANVAGARVTEDNPALPGETIIVYSTGLGLIKPLEALALVGTGERYKGTELNEPIEFVSSLAGGKTANVLYAGLKTGEVGLYEVHLELNSDLPTNPATQLTIAQDIYVSNIIAFAVRNPNTP